MINSGDVLVSGPRETLVLSDLILRETYVRWFGFGLLGRSCKYLERWRDQFQDFVNRGDKKKEKYKLPELCLWLDRD